MMPTSQVPHRGTPEVVATLDKSASRRWFYQTSYGAVAKEAGVCRETWREP